MTCAPKSRSSHPITSTRPTSVCSPATCGTASSSTRSHCGDDIDIRVTAGLDLGVVNAGQRPAGRPMGGFVTAMCPPVVEMAKGCEAHCGLQHRRPFMHSDPNQEARGDH